MRFNDDMKPFNLLYSQFMLYCVCKICYLINPDWSLWSGDNGKSHPQSRSVFDRSNVIIVTRNQPDQSVLHQSLWSGDTKPIGAWWWEVSHRPISSWPFQPNHCSRTITGSPQSRSVLDWQDDHSDSDFFSPCHISWLPLTSHACMSCTKLAAEVLL